jgi:hypothetical protein
VTNPNRIEQTTPAPSEPPKPSTWGNWPALIAAVLGGAAVAVGAVLAAPVVTPALVIGAVLSGGGTGALGYFGLRSAGPK